VSSEAASAPAAPPEVLPQSHDRKQAQEADGDEGRFNDSSHDIAKRERFVLPPEDREQHDGGADVGDDEDHLEERSESDAVVGAGADDVVGVVQHRGVENELCWDGSHEGDDEEQADNECSPSQWAHLDSLPVDEIQRPGGTLLHSATPWPWALIAACGLKVSLFARFA